MVIKKETQLYFEQWLEIKRKNLSSAEEQEDNDAIERLTEEIDLLEIITDSIGELGNIRA